MFGCGSLENEFSDSAVLVLREMALNFFLKSDIQGISMVCMRAWVFIIQITVLVNDLYAFDSLLPLNGIIEVFITECFNAIEIIIC